MLQQFDIELDKTVHAVMVHKWQLNGIQVIESYGSGFLRRPHKKYNMINEESELSQGAINRIKLLCIKGQLISKCPFGVIVWAKISALAPKEWSNQKK